MAEKAKRLRSRQLGPDGGDAHLFNINSHRGLRSETLTVLLRLVLEVSGFRDRP
jgi:hypothetical protein